LAAARFQKRKKIRKSQVRCYGGKKPRPANTVKRLTKRGEGRIDNSLKDLSEEAEKACERRARKSKRHLGRGEREIRIELERERYRSG